MEELAERLFFFFVGLFHANLFLLRSLIMLIRKGPKTILEKKEVKEPPKDLLDPVYGEHCYMHLGPVRLHYVISGPVGAPLMLFLHGWPEMWYSWRDQIKEFQKDFRVVAVDMRGFGDSDKPKDLKKYRITHHVEDTRAFMDAIGYKSCVLVSHDWGGCVAYAFAAQYPKMVDRLVVMNMAPVELWRNGFTSRDKPKQFLRSGYIYLFMLPYLPEFLLSLEDVAFLNKAFLAKPVGVISGKMNEGHVDCYKYYLRKPGAMESSINIYRANLHINPSSHPLDLPMPVHIVWGCKDVALGPELLADTLRAIPHASSTRVEEASHWVQMDQPEAANKAVRDFLVQTDFNIAKT